DVAGDEIRMRAADDLAGCALIVAALRTLREERAPHDVHAIFTRAEETGLYGARLAAEDGLLPRDAYVVSVEASRALPGAEAGRAAGSDADESWWPDVRVTPDVIRERLRRDRPKRQ